MPIVKSPAAMEGGWEAGGGSRRRGEVGGGGKGGREGGEKQRGREALQLFLRLLCLNTCVSAYV